MPYDKITELPDSTKKLPKEAKEIYQSAFNSAYDQYKGEEGREAHAHATAWTAVERKFKKDGDKWVAKESLQKLYSEIIQESGRRNASKDAGRIKEILKLCQELLDSEDEEKVQEAINEANEVLEWLKLQELVKTEDGEQYPARAYAYAPEDGEWKLRLWENGEVSKNQLAKAAAALSPGGFRGEKSGIPKEHLTEVKRRIREEYRKLGIEEDIPRWVRESESRFLLDNYTSLEEATVGSKGIARVVVIKPGFGNPVDNHYYPSETLARDFSVFEGVKMYSDHQTDEEEKQRPEGSIRQWVASLKNVRFEEGVGIVGDAVVIEPWLQQKLATLRDQNLLSEMGISIRAAGVGTKGKVNGEDANVVERITRVRSVDFVTQAGAGGGVLLYETEREFDIDIVTLDVFKERRPDLVKTIESGVKEILMKEAKMTQELEDRIKELEEEKGTLITERDEAQTKLTEAETAQRKAEAKSVIDEAISKSELPEAAKTRIVEKYKDAESSDGVEDAIKAEETYIEALRESNKVKNLGGSKPDPEKSNEALRDSFKSLGMSDAEAEIAAKGR